MVTVSGLPCVAPFRLRRQTCHISSALDEEDSPIKMLYVAASGEWKTSCKSKHYCCISLVQEWKKVSKLSCRAGAFWKADGCSRSNVRNGPPFLKHTAGRGLRGGGVLSLSAIFLTGIRALLVLLSNMSANNPYQNKNTPALQAISKLTHLTFKEHDGKDFDKAVTCLENHLSQVQENCAFSPTKAKPGRDDQQLRIPV